jgi:hypothetical protein
LRHPRRKAPGAMDPIRFGGNGTSAMRATWSSGKERASKAVQSGKVRRVRRPGRRRKAVRASSSRLIPDSSLLGGEEHSCRARQKGSPIPGVHDFLRSHKNLGAAQQYRAQADRQARGPGASSSEGRLEKAQEGSSFDGVLTSLHEHACQPCNRR